MAASDISPDQFTKLCRRCACLQLRSTTADETLLPTPSTGKQEVDLDWNVTDVLENAFHESRHNCGCCNFLRRVIYWWQFHDVSVAVFSAKYVPISLHYVFGDADQYGLRALRIRIRPDGQEFHIDCPITAASDHDIGTSLRLRPPLSHINKESLSWIKSKLESCVLHDHINPNKCFIPDRLIDVRGDQLSLVLTKDFEPRQDTEAPRYVALTYCWGPEPHASRQLKTTRANIAQHQQQIPQLSLPQVIKDAVSVTRALSIPFLWVDALCILQDDASDWDKQCAEMERIYGNAYATVAAASSHNCEEGFVRRTDRILLPFGPHSDDAHAFGIYSPLYKADPIEDLILSPWLERGWTFQERIASTRILMFSKRNIHFKCNFFSESMGRERNTKDEDYIMLDRVTIDSGSTAAIHEEWGAIMSQISRDYYKFTRETDFLPSIAGIAALFSQRLNDEYAAGIWKKNMHRSLYWATLHRAKLSYQVLLKDLETPSPYIAPSWSWASRRESFRFDLYRSGLADCRPEFNRLETTVTLRGESAFGEVADASLNITAKVYVGSPRMTYYEVVPHTGRPIETLRLNGRYFAEIEPDCSAEDLFQSSQGRELATPISFLLIGGAIRRYAEGMTFPVVDPDFETIGSDDDTASDFEAPMSLSMSSESGGDFETETVSKRAAYGLLIHPTGNPNEYYRVGTFFSKPSVAGGLSFFDNVELKTVRLV